MKIKKSAKESATVRVSSFLEPVFQLAMAELTLSDELPIEVSYKVLRMSEYIDKQRETYEQLRLKLINKYGSKDAEGRLKLSADSKNYVMEDKAAFDREYSKLLEITCELNKLPLSEVKAAKLSAHKLRPLLGTVLSPES